MGWNKKHLHEKNHPKIVHEKLIADPDFNPLCVVK